MAVFTIPFAQPFLAALAQGLAARYGSEGLEDALILLPTRRSVRGLTEALLALAPGTGDRAILLPRIRAIGDVDEDELAMEIEGVGALADGLGEALEALPPPMPALERSLILARLVRARGDASPADALRLARELARLLDLAAAEGADLGRLETIVPDAHAAHWQRSLEFLRIVTDAWPRILAERGRSDRVRHRDALLRALAAAWTARPPPYPVIAAGSTGSIPATAELLAVVASLGEGAVILPGLDQDLEEASFTAVADGHPQAQMKRLLARLGLERSAVGPWLGAAIPAARRARVRLVHEALRPAATTERWQDLGRLVDIEAALGGLSVIEAADEAREAGAIALLMRHALETPGRSATLVTPDRGLARRVAAELARFGIAIDDSAGRPLALGVPAVFLRLVAQAAAAGLGPVPLLAVLRHPLARLGRSRAELGHLVGRLERAALRGMMPAPGIAGMAARLAEGPQEQELGLLLADLEEALAPFLAVLDKGEAPAGELIRAHVATAEALARDGEGSGSALWAGEEGALLSDILGEALEGLSELGPPIACDAWPALFEALLEPHEVRPRFGLHPRLAILGPLEARLQTADVMILGGLNEGTWPADPGLDPWLGRPMRAALGLPPPERRLGLAAHDFAELASQPCVVLTRARRVAGSLEVPSRWLLRLKNLLAGAGALDRLEPAIPFAAIAEALARPIKPPSPCVRPAPCPPVSVRPRSFSVTEMRTLNRDPYAVYAQRILRLKPLEPLAAPPGAALKGVLVHAALAAFRRALPPELPDEAAMRALFAAAAEEAIARHAPDDPVVWALWRPAMLKLASAAAAFERSRRREGGQVLAEVEGAMTIGLDGGPVRVHGRADRIELDAAGRAVILDYKTGAPPSARQVESGLEPQLPLEALIAEDGGFAALGGRKVDLAGIAAVKVPFEGPFEPRMIASAEGEPDLGALLAETRARLRAKLDAFDIEATAYLSRSAVLRAGEDLPFDHLARVGEWSVVGSDGEGEDAP